MIAKRTRQILALLDEHYGTEPICYLQHANDWQLLFATILSAQCTDERVNQVTETLFVKYPALSDFAAAKLKTLEQDIYQTGFYHNKAKNIIACANRLLSEYDGRVPDTMEELLTLPGVGRKTANVILGNIYQKPGIVVDTHVKRISGKLGLTKETDPEKIEHDLEKALPKDHWILWNMQIITFGRTICYARNPQCEACFLREYCKWNKALSGKH